MRENGRVQPYRDDGIVLRTQKLGEADRIITVLGPTTGRVRAVAKGVRRTKSRFGARLEPFTHVDLMLHPGRSLDVITQAEVIRPYGEPLAADYPRYTAGVAMLETAERFTPVEKEPALRQLLLLIGGLRALVEQEHDPAPDPGRLPAALARGGRRTRPPWRSAPAAARRDGRRRRPAPAPARLRRRGGRYGLRLLPPARSGVARGGDGGPDARAAARGLGRTPTAASEGTR